MGQQQVRSKFVRHERFRPSGRQVKVMELLEGNVTGEPVELDDGTIGVWANGVVYVPTNANADYQIQLYENGQLVAEHATPSDQPAKTNPPRGLHALAALTLYEKAQGKRPTTAGRAWDKFWGKSESDQ